MSKRDKEKAKFAMLTLARMLNVKPEELPESAGEEFLEQYERIIAEEIQFANRIEKQLAEAYDAYDALFEPRTGPYFRAMQKVLSHYKRYKVGFIAELCEKDARRAMKWDVSNEASTVEFYAELDAKLKENPSNLKEADIKLLLSIFDNDSIGKSEVEKFATGNVANYFYVITEELRLSLDELERQDKEASSLIREAYIDAITSEMNVDERIEKLGHEFSRKSYYNKLDKAVAKLAHIFFTQIDTEGTVKRLREYLQEEK